MSDSSGRVISLKIDEYLNKAEERILKKGKMISSWYSSTRGASLGNMKADLLVRGNMAVKGFVLSRMWSWSAPRWETLALVFSHKQKERVSLQQLTRSITEAENYMSRNDIKWSWLVHVSEMGFDEETVRFVKARSKKEIGIMLVNPALKSFVYNNVLVNKYGVKVFKP